MVRAKFKCESKAQIVGGTNIKLVPVTTGSPENEQYFKWTPFGSIEIGTLNEAAASQFIPGKEYYVDFTPAK